MSFSLTQIETKGNTVQNNNFKFIYINRKC